MAYDEAAIAAVFGRAAPAYDSVIPFFGRFGRILVDAASLAPGERVVDVGCGRGATLLPAAAAVGDTGRVTGVDLSAEMVELLAADLARAGVTNASVRQGSAQALDLPDDSVDVAIVSMVLHLLPDPPAAAGELHRVVAPGGRCAALVPSGGRGWEKLSSLFASYGPRVLSPQAVPFRNDFDLPGLLSEAGFEVVRDEQVEEEFWFPDPQAWWDWGWTGGIRSLYEVLSEDDLARLRTDAFEVLETMTEAGGIPLLQRVHLVIGSKPAS